VRDCELPVGNDVEVVGAYFKTSQNSAGETGENLEKL
jgi:hypothetical protein